MVESGRVPGKGIIRASIEKLSWRVPEKGRICVSTQKWWNLGEYREKVESLRVLKNYPDEYREKIESLGVSKNYLGEYPEKGRIYVSTENW